MKKETVIVTGASRGIGRAIAEKFAVNGYNVLINYNKSEKEAMELYKELLERNLSVKTFKADITNRHEVKSMMDYCIKEFGELHVLVNNAGISQERLFSHITDEDWDNMINTNLKGTFYCCQEGLKYMIPEKRGKIINISSIWGMTGGSCEVHYSVSKAGIIGLTKSLAKELGPSNIQVNAIAPGVIHTDMMVQYDEEVMRNLKDETPLGRIGAPEDIANCAYFLGSSESNFITGQVISPNGGFVI